MNENWQSRWNNATVPNKDIFKNPTTTINGMDLRCGVMASGATLTDYAVAWPMQKNAIEMGLHRFIQM
jgi:hypothetical protein